MTAKRMNEKRPKFLRAFIDDVGRDVDERGWRAIVPYCLASTAVFGAGVAYLVPEIFWTNQKWDISTAVYAGMLTFNGLVLALGWNAFARIYDVLLRGDFGKYLMKNDLLGDYLLQITYMHAFQILAALAASVGLVSVLIDGVPLAVDRVVLAATLALTLYAIKQSVNAVTAMNDIVWQSAYYEINKPPVTASTNVVSIGADH